MNIERMVSEQIFANERNSFTYSRQKSGGHRETHGERLNDEKPGLRISVAQNFERTEASQRLWQWKADSYFLVFSQIHKMNAYYICR